MKTEIFCRESREIKRLSKAFSFNDFSMINGPIITLSIYLKRTYNGLSRYVTLVVLNPVISE